MTRDKIIEKLFTGKNFRDCINKMEPAHLRQELQSEVILKVCEWPAERIEGLYQRRELEFYVAKVILNEVRNKYSSFYKKFMIATVQWIDERTEEPEFHRCEPMSDVQVVPSAPFLKDEIHSREVRELSEDKALEAIDQLDWYDQELVKLYIRVGTYRAIERETGIPWESAYKSIQKSLKAIRCQVLKLSSTV